MPIERGTYGNCSFVIPDGFAVQGGSWRLPSSASAKQPSSQKQKKFFSVTLNSTTKHTDVPDYSESPRDLTPRAFPVSITLTFHRFAGFPIVFLRNTEAVLQAHFENYKIYFCETDKIGDHSAARSQSSFNNNFEIFRLNYAWSVDRGLPVATLMVAEAGLTKGWMDLRQFVASVRFE